MNVTFLTINELATLLKLPKSWIYSRTREKGSNRIPCTKIGKYLRFEENKVLSWIEHQQKQGNF